MASALERLPDEVLLAALGRLDRRGLGAALRTSRRLRDVARRARWAEIVVDPAARRGAAAVRDVGGLVRALDRGDVAAVGRLDLGPLGFHVYISALTVLEAVSRAGVELDELALRVSDQTQLAAAAMVGARATQRARRLEAVVCSARNEREEVAAALARAFPAVSSLSFRCFTRESDGIDGILGAFPNVEELELRMSNPYIANAALRRLPRLRALAYRDMSWRGLEGCALPERARGTLRRLEVDGAVHLTDCAGIARWIGGPNVLEACAVRGLRVDIDDANTSGLLDQFGGVALAVRSSVWIRGDAPVPGAVDALVRWLGAGALDASGTLWVDARLSIDEIERVAAAVPRGTRGYRRDSYPLSVGEAPREMAALLARGVGAAEIDVAYGYGAHDPDVGDVAEALAPLRAIVAGAPTTPGTRRWIVVRLSCDPVRPSPILLGALLRSLTSEASSATREVEFCER